MISLTRFLAALGVLLGVACSAVAQPGKVWRVGYLGNASTDASPDTARAWAAFVQEFRDRGYVEGRNLVFERRFAEGKPDRYAALAAELAQMKLDVIVAAANVGARTMKDATCPNPVISSCARSWRTSPRKDDCRCSASRAKWRGWEVS